jgi:hypothetical protein
MRIIGGKEGKRSNLCIIAQPPRRSLSPNRTYKGRKEKKGKSDTIFQKIGEVEAMEEVKAVQHSLK